MYLVPILLSIFFSLSLYGIEREEADQVQQVKQKPLIPSLNDLIWRLHIMRQLLGIPMTLEEIVEQLPRVRMSKLYFKILDFLEDHELRVGIPSTKKEIDKMAPEKG